jgi:serine phosphatase RsbU (regulator of sigma subunit)
VRRWARPETLTFFGLVLLLVGGFAYAAYLANYGASDTSNAFDYQTAVILARRDSEVLRVERLEHHTPEQTIRFDVKILDDDLTRINGTAKKDGEPVANLRIPEDRNDFDQLDAELAALQDAGELRFKATLAQNERVRKVSNALFALVAFLAFLLTFIQARLQRRIEEGRSVVELLQRAFVSRRKELPNFGLGAVLLSATAGSDIGGDLYDVYAIDERFGAFLIADVSGKGIDAAVDTAFIKYSIRTLVGESRDPGRTLTRFAALFERNIERRETFVVLFLGVVDTESGEVRYASAGHEPAWMRVGGEIVPIAPTGPIVGILDEVEYETRVLRLAAGDMILVTTDGLTESRDDRGVELGAAGVARWFAEADGTAQQMADRMVSRLRKRSRRIGDDLAILALRYMPKRGAGARPARIATRPLPQPVRVPETPA